MKKLLAAVALSAFALTSVAPMAQAAPRTTGLHQAEMQNVHKVASKKSTKKPTKKVTKASKKKPAKSSTPAPRKA